MTIMSRQGPRKKMFDNCAEYFSWKPRSNRVDYRNSSRLDNPEKHRTPVTTDQDARIY